MPKMVKSEAVMRFTPEFHRASERAFRRSRLADWRRAGPLPGRAGGESFGALSLVRAHDDGDELRRGRHAEDRNIKAAVIGLLIEWSLHQRFGHNADDGAPLLRLSRIEDSNPAAERAVVTKIFLRETGAHDRDRLFRIDVINGEVASLQNLQAHGRKVSVRDKLEVALRPVSVGHVTFAIDFILAEAAKGHAKTAGHGGAIEGRIAAKRAQCPHEKLLARLRCRVVAIH